MLAALVGQYMEQATLTPHGKAALNGLVSYVKSNNLDFTKLEADDWRGLFSSYRSTNAIVIQRYKSEVTKFYRWLIESKLADVEDTLVILTNKKLFNKAVITFDKRMYFPNYQTMIDSFESVMNNGYWDTYSSSSMLGAYLTLAWFGLDGETTLSLLKSDLEFDDDGLHIKGRCIRNHKAIEVIQTYHDEAGTEHRNGTFHCYKSSAYLFRSTVNERVTSRSIATLLNRCNTVAESKGVIFSHDHVFYSAVYAKTYDGMKLYGYPITLNPYPPARKRLGQMFELSETQLANPAAFLSCYRNFYAWCKEFRTVDG